MRSFVRVAVRRCVAVLMQAPSPLVLCGRISLVTCNPLRVVTILRLLILTTASGVEGKTTPLCGGLSLNHGKSSRCGWGQDWPKVLSLITVIRGMGNG